MDAIIFVIFGILVGLSVYLGKLWKDLIIVINYKGNHAKRKKNKR